MSGERGLGACPTVTTLARRGAGGAARAVCGRDCRTTPGPHLQAPTATGCLISHYNLRAARFLPLLLPRFILRIIECIPLAPSAMRAERRPVNSPRNYAPRALADATQRDTPTTATTHAI